MKILVFCAKGFETMEFSVFIDVMGWARNDYGFPVETETCGFNKIVDSTFDVSIIVLVIAYYVQRRKFENFLKTV